jgi:prepilin-type N-terminal cleavage/methylation domain-containing protein
MKISIQSKSKKGFTLIELMVTITIAGILSLTVYAPYQYYSEKQKVKNSAKIVTQTLYEARSLAINGVNTSN